jgi:hypothetical protein
MGWQTPSNSFCLLELLLFSQLVSVQPLDGVIALVQNNLPVSIGDLVLQFFILHGALHVKAVRFQSVLGGNL